jgi:hypothetical protein
VPGLSTPQAAHATLWMCKCDAISAVRGIGVVWNVPVDGTSAWYGRIQDVPFQIETLSTSYLSD